MTTSEYTLFTVSNYDIVLKTTVQGDAEELDEETLQEILDQQAYEVVATRRTDTRYVIEAKTAKGVAILAKLRALSYTDDQLITMLRPTPADNQKGE